MGRGDALDRTPRASRWSLCILRTMRLASWWTAAGILVLGCSKSEPPQPAAPVASAATAAIGSASASSDAGKRVEASSDASAGLARTPKALDDAVWAPGVSRHIISHNNKQLALLEVTSTGVTLKVEAEGKSAADFKQEWAALHPEKGFDESIHAPRKGNERGPLESHRFGPTDSAWKLLLKEKLEARHFSLGSVPRWPDSTPPTSMREFVAEENGKELGVISFSNNNATLKRSASDGGGLFFKSFFESAVSEPPLIVFYARPSGDAGADTLVVVKSRPGEASYPAAVRAYFATHINRYDRYVYTVVP